MSMFLDMKQSMGQEMRLSPRMIQSMEILTLPVLQLEERIREELEKNPALEAGVSTAEIPSTDFEAKYSENPSENGVVNLEPPPPGEEVSKREEKLARERDAFEQMYEEYGDNYIPSHQPSKWAGLELSDKKQEAISNEKDRPASLQDHLLQQLPLLEGEPVTLEFAAHIIANLDEKGYLTTPLDELRNSFEGEISEDQSQEALAIVQELEPAGVGATDHQECLLLQLDDPNPGIHHVEMLRDLITHAWDDLWHKRLPAVEKKTGYSMEEIYEALAEIKRFLSLNPAAAFASAPTQYVVPDLELVVDEEGEYVVKLNDESTPSVFISPQYLEALKKKQSDEQAKEYIRQKVQQARWLIGAIEQRRSTLQKVAKAIVDHQRDFLEKGPDFIHPLKMQHIADKVGVNVTTISRAVADKWIETSQGVFPLRRFFHSGTVTSDGKEIAYDTIKRRLQDLVDAEDKSAPLSDDDLVSKLKAMGFPLARRTVTKYRKELSIPSSRERKQF
jgi:RNA polymerase sigma-54 factor